ncbi:biotin-dependent carboxyltransferase family protein [Alkalicoccus halolimnae]|uniref:Biotin-dependent carboxyltransferase family protein n=1 Tax=Alkalicoccus halolimnae TaxID=1667239 RepID=A0A5C7F7Q0_9BACI|nr:biotin-dependent carboxyltransferase family protein [Alkalicoccus halolimnae]TXF85600.1 biotin-dependent carboxyltransferase [Alkalicoccus halolimnae]
MSGFKVEKQGLLTTVQDKGRMGYQQYGIVVSGAVDPLALRLANAVVGNPDSAAGLEVTMMGPELIMTADSMISVGGGDLSAAVDGREIPMWTAVKVYAGQRISFGEPRFGVRAYIAFAGGIDVPEEMGSRATYLKAEIGGFHGRELQAGDEVNIFSVQRFPCRRRLHPALLPNYDKGTPIRVIEGPDEKLFSGETKDIFYDSKFYLTNEVDRMGCRMEGPSVPPEEGSGILSDATTMGTIQIPGDGLPMLLMADRQTSGGYARIGTVIQEDLPRVAQCGPGEPVRFTAVSVKKAQEIYARREKRFRCFARLALT